jgi:hypothetical protein
MCQRQPRSEASYGCWTAEHGGGLESWLVSRCLAGRSQKIQVAGLPRRYGSSQPLDILPLMSSRFCLGLAQPAEAMWQQRAAK